MSEGANFADIYLRGMRDRSLRSETELAREIQANWFFWFRPRQHWRNLFHFLQRRDCLSIVQITYQLKFVI